MLARWVGMRHWVTMRHHAAAAFGPWSTAAALATPIGVVST